MASSCGVPVRARCRGHEDRLDRVSSDVVAEVLQAATNTRVPPSRILVRHARDERRDVRLGGRATRAPRLRTVVFRGDESPVPAQDRVGCHDAGDGCEVTTAEEMTFHGETASLVVGQRQASGTVQRAKDAVFLEQVVDNCLLVSIDPAENRSTTKANGDGSGAMAGACLSARPSFNGCARHTRRRFLR